MKSMTLQMAGLGVIVVALVLWWILDRFGCSFNTAGCSRILPDLSMGAISWLILPVGVGTALVLYGRRLD